MSADFLPEAEEEHIDASLFYDLRVLGLGDRSVKWNEQRAPMCGAKWRCRRRRLGPAAGVRRPEDVPEFGRPMSNPRLHGGRRHQPISGGGAAGRPAALTQTL